MVKKILVWLGKQTVGLAFFLSTIGVVFFIAGFFFQGMTEEYVQQNGLFFGILVLISIGLAFPVWKWRKEILRDAWIFLIP